MIDLVRRCYQIEKSKHGGADDDSAVHKLNRGFDSSWYGRRRRRDRDSDPLAFHIASHATLAVTMIKLGYWIALRKVVAISSAWAKDAEKLALAHGKIDRFTRIDLSAMVVVHKGG